MSFEFTRPWLLMLLALAGPWLVWFFLRSLSDFPQRQRLVSLATRGLIVTLIVLSLAGLTWLHSTDEQFVVFAIDDSLSVGDEGRAKVRELLDAALRETGPHRVAFLPFAKEPGQMRETRPEGRSDESDATKTGDSSNGAAAKTTMPVADTANAGTDIAAALEAAAGYIPPGYVPRIVLLSDGNETRGDAAAAALRSELPIDSLPLPTRGDPEVQISEVGVPAEVREGEPFFVEVVVHSNHDDEGLIEVYRGDHKVVGEKQRFKAGENRFRFQQSIERERLAAFAVRVSGLQQDTLLDNNSDSGLVFAAGKPRVLIVESDPNLIRELAYALEDEGIQADIRPPQGMPDSLSDLQNYELLILSNVPATALTQKQMEMARTYVQELGGGLIMLGGEQSFGLGGYYKSTLEEILPVRSDFEKEKEKPSLAMVLVIDKSGSMDGDKIEMAKSAARSAVELLGQRDQVAVVAFDGETFLISELQRATNKAAIDDDIGRIDSGGGTSMYPAMEMAHELLINANAKLKHAILLTDGVSEPGDFEGLAQTMASGKMTVSTVAVGEGCDTELLENIARVGKGRYYLTTDPAQVPQIFAKETVTASKSAIDEQPFVPQVVRATHALNEIDLDSAPFLLGYVITRPKPTCEVILATENGDPLLAWWRYGLGMTAAFTSDAKSRWAAEWMTWPGFGKFWTQVIRQTMRKSDARGLAVRTTRHGRDVHLDLDAVDDLGRFMNAADVELTLIDPRLRRSNSKLLQSAPGQYAIDFTTETPGAYHLELEVKQQGQSVYRQSRGLTVGYSDELRIKPTNDELLRRVSELSGGRCRPDPAKLFESDGRTTTRPTALWPWLLSAAVLLLVLDVALRRIDFSLHWPFARSRSGS